MNNRQIELQNIIRNLENKILIQREQIKILTQRSDRRIKLIEQDHSRKLMEKQRLIEYLTVQLDKDRQLIIQEQFLYDSKRNREKDEIFKEYERYKLKSTDLQKKLQGIIEKYELEKKQLENQLKKLQDKEYDQSFSKAQIEVSIEKLNKFYNQSRVEQPKRKQLLENAEKISTFIHKSQDKNKNHLEELLSYIKHHLESFKSDVITNLTHVSEFEEQMTKNKKEILIEIKDIVKEQNKNKNEMLQSNQKLYQLLKKEKSNLQIQRMNQQQKQLTELKKRYEQRKQQLQSRIKQLQAERKTLLLGFTQLKTLNETRQKTYKQQINALKRTIQGLMQNGQQRQLQFQKQMRVLHDQLTSISQRYYENIEMPLTKMTSRLDSEIKTARVELQKLSENKGFMKMIQNLEETMQRYIAQKTNTQVVAKELADYAHKSKHLVELAQRMYNEESQREIYGRESEKNQIHETQGVVASKINSLEANLKQVQNRQRQNKLVYELNTAKKFNKKLKQYCDNLEMKISSTNDRSVSPLKKSKANVPINKSNTKVAENTVRVLQLQSQVERLKLLNKDYGQQYCLQLSNIKSHIEKLTGKQVKDEKNFSFFQKGLKDLSIFNEKLQKYINQQSTHVNQIRQILSNVNKVLLKPVQIFDGFVEKITNCYHPSFVPPKASIAPSEKSPIYLFSNLQEVYKELYTKRQQNNNQTTKLFLDFIKLLRQTAPQHMKSHQKTSINLESERENLEKSRIVAKQSMIEKKIKQLQAVRLKSREQLIRRLEKIEQALRTIEAKYGKRNFASIGKIEELMGRKLDEIKQKCMQKLRQNNTQINEITGNVIKDLKNRLKTCLNQNEGLMKQIQLLQMHRKKQESK